MTEYEQHKKVLDEKMACITDKMAELIKEETGTEMYFTAAIFPGDGPNCFAILGNLAQEDLHDAYSTIADFLFMMKSKSEEELNQTLQ